MEGNQSIQSVTAKSIQQYTLLCQKAELKCVPICYVTCLQDNITNCNTVHGHVVNCAIGCNETMQKEESMLKYTASQYSEKKTNRCARHFGANFIVVGRLENT